VLSYLIEHWRQSYSLIHRNVAEAIIGLAEFREVERKRVPGTSFAKRSGWSASFGEYDPHVEGDELTGS